MGSRKGKPADLARRCETVGWEVTMSKAGHYRVKTHTGAVFSFASTPGDWRTGVNDESKAKKYGLHELESELGDRREQERLQRIEVDRKNGVQWDAEETKMENEELKKITEDFNLGQVNGVAIVERAPAAAVHPRGGDVKVPIKYGEELLMADESIIYRCIYQVNLNHIDQDCGRMFESAPSLRSHIAWHARQVKPEVEEPSNFFDDPQADDDENEVSEIIEKQPGIVSRLVYLASEFDELVDDIVELVKSTHVKRNELRKLLAELPQHVADGATLEKARKYDAMKKLLD